MVGGWHNERLIACVCVILIQRDPATGASAHEDIAGDDEEDDQPLERHDERAGHLHGALHFVRAHQHAAEEEGGGNRAQGMEFAGMVQNEG